LENILKFSGWLLENIERDDFYKKELNTSFWSADGKFDQSIREKLLKIADDFYKALKINATIKDIHLTGSLANYNWTNKSDLDVHILIDFNDIDENVDLVKKALDGQRFIWNTRHKIVIRNHDVELYIQDFQEPHIASGLFSLLNNEWIKTPSYKPPSIDYRDVDKKFEGLVNDIQQIESLLNLSDFSVTTEQDLYRHALSIKDKILKMRREGLARDGEFAIENLTFKKLRNEGYIEKIIELISKAYTNIYNE
jgi:predicted nucleotidyltransferase